MTQSWRDRVPKQVAVLTDAQRDASRAAAMADAPDGDIWVFGYGSLLWNPCFDPAAHRVGRLDGYRRAFNFWSLVSRGTPEWPGLGLSLEPAPGSVCVSQVYQLRPESLAQDSRALWDREMHSGIYRPAWVDVSTDAGNLTALTFVADFDHPQYAGGLTMDQRAEIIAGAHGKFGPCHDYLRLTVERLAALGIQEPELDDLLARVDRLLTATPRSGN